MSDEEINSTSNPGGGIFENVEMSATEEEKSIRHGTALKGRVLRTLFAYGAFMAMGAVNSLLGTSLVDIEYIYRVDTKTVSFVFLSYNLGYVIGCVLLGFLYEQVNEDLQLAMGVLTFGLAGSFGLFCNNFIEFAIVMGVKGIGMGYVDSAAQPYILHLWTNHRFQNPVLHLSHCLYSLGSFIAPLLLRVFLLPELPIGGSTSINGSTRMNSDMIENAPHAVCNTSDHIMTTVLPNIIGNGTNVCQDLEEKLHRVTGNMTKPFHPLYEDHQIMNVKYGYIAVCTICIPVILGHLLAFTCREQNGPNEESKEQVKEDSNKNQKKRDTHVLLVILFFMLFFYEITEDTSGSFVATYAIKGLHWEKSKGPLMTSVLWGAGLGGHLLSIPLSYFLTPTHMVIIGNALATGAFGTLLLASFTKVPDFIIWGSIATAGIAFSSYLGSVFLWAATYIDVDGTASSVCIMATACGAISGSWGTGVLFDLYTPHAFVYVVLSCCIAVMLLFYSALFFARHSSLATSDEGPETTTDDTSVQSIGIPSMRRGSLAIHII